MNTDQLKVLAYNGDLRMADRFCEKRLRQIFSMKYTENEARELEEMLIFASSYGNRACIHMGVEYYCFRAAVSIFGGRRSISERFYYYDKCRLYVNMAERIFQQVNIDPHYAKTVNGKVLYEFTEKTFPRKRRRVMRYVTKKMCCE